jgi:methyl-accepting chemotaxis protein
MNLPIWLGFLFGIEMSKSETYLEEIATNISEIHSDLKIEFSASLESISGDIARIADALDANSGMCEVLTEIRDEFSNQIEAINRLSASADTLSHAVSKLNILLNQDWFQKAFLR